MGAAGCIALEREITMADRALDAYDVFKTVDTAPDAVEGQTP